MLNNKVGMIYFFGNIVSESWPCVLFRSSC